MRQERDLAGEYGAALGLTQTILAPMQTASLEMQQQVPLVS
jgi:hypothetical protein